MPFVFRHAVIGLLLGAGLAHALPAAAEVKEQNDAGFLILHSATVPMEPDALWKKLVAPNSWWGAEHSWTGDADNLYLDAQAGGCFCERIRDRSRDGDFVNRGSVEHMRVIHVDPDKVLRMTGALGPLQSEGVAATLTIVMGREKGRTRLTFGYVVGGFVRFGMAKTAPVIDRIIGAQFARLVAAAGGPAAVSREAIEAEQTSGEEAPTQSTVEPDETSVVPPIAPENLSPDDAVANGPSPP